MTDVMYATLAAGSVEYDIKKARVPIDEFIAALQQEKEDGATHVVGLSGNYRGASWVRLGMPEYDPDLDTEEDDDE